MSLVLSRQTLKQSVAALSKFFRDIRRQWLGQGNRHAGVWEGAVENERDLAAACQHLVEEYLGHLQIE